MYQVQYPTNYELKLLEPDLQADAMLGADPIFEDFPIASKPVANIEWVMRENISGLQQARGMDGQAPRIQNLGASLYSMVPGIYGEQTVISERELTTRAPYNAPGAVINIDDLVVERMKILIAREVQRVRVNIWTLLTTGIFTVMAPGTGTLQQMGQYDIRTANVVAQTASVYAAPTATNPNMSQILTGVLSGIGWATSATCTPLQDLLAVQQLMEAGTSCRFSTNAKMYMNRKTFNYIINAASMGTRWFVGGDGSNAGMLPGIKTVANLFENFDLPRPIVVNDVYLDDGKNNQYYVPDNKIVWVGSRPSNDLIGEYVQTRNASDPNFAPEPYIKIKDDPDIIPRNISIDRGHNGGPAIYYPNGVVVITVN
jgi:hypothetical protein